MTRKIFRSILLVAGVVLAAGMVIMTGCLYSYFGGVQEQQLQDELSLAVSGVENGGTAYLERLPAERFRLTWIASDGRVLYDTQVVDVASMENHAGRQEVQEALKNGSGESSRYSDTLLQQTLYVARRLTDGTVLRISVSRATAGSWRWECSSPCWWCWAAALIFAGLMAGRLSRRIVDPLNRLDLEHPLENDAYEELAPLLSRINYQHKEIDAQLRTLRQKTDEFTQITGSMQEGLVLLDEKGTVLSINHAACRLFQADDGCVGRDFLTVDRSHELSLALETAPEGGPQPTALPAQWPGVPDGYEPHPVRRRDGGYGAADLRRDRAGVRRAQPPGVHRQRLPRTEDPPAGHRGQRRADSERHGEAGRICPALWAISTTRPPAW